MQTPCHKTLGLWWRFVVNHKLPQSYHTSPQATTRYHTLPQTYHTLPHYHIFWRYWLIPQKISTEYYVFKQLQGLSGVSPKHHFGGLLLPTTKNGMSLYGVIPWFGGIGITRNSVLLCIQYGIMYIAINRFTRLKRFEFEFSAMWHVHIRYFCT